MKNEIFHILIFRFLGLINLFLPKKINFLRSVKPKKLDIVQFRNSINKKIQNKSNQNKFSLDVERDIKPFFYVYGNFDIIRCSDYLNFESVLDIGCGRGGASLYFANQGKKVTSLTIRETFHSYNQEWFDKLNIQVDDCDFEVYETKEKFDAIWMSHCLEHTQNPGIFLKKCWKYLNDNGYLMVLVPPYNHLLTNGHFSTGWNFGTLLYNLYVSGFNIKDGHYVRHGDNLCAFVQKDNNRPQLENVYTSIEDCKDDWPFKAAHHSSFENLFVFNWFSDQRFIKQFEKEHNRREQIKLQDKRYKLQVYNQILRNSFYFQLKLNRLKKTLKQKKVLLKASPIIFNNFNFSGFNIIGSVDCCLDKENLKEYKLTEIEKSVHPDVVLIANPFSAWLSNHKIPRLSLSNDLIVIDNVFDSPE